MSLNPRFLRKIRVCPRPIASHLILMVAKVSLLTCIVTRQPSVGSAAQSCNRAFLRADYDAFKLTLPKGSRGSGPYYRSKVAQVACSL